MKHLAAYLLAVLGGNEKPDAAAIKKICEAVSVDVDDECITRLLAAVEDKVRAAHSLALQDLKELIDAGKKKLVSVGGGGGRGGGGGGAAPAAAGAPGAKEEKKEEKKEEEEEDAGGAGGLFGVSVLPAAGLLFCSPPPRAFQPHPPCPRSLPLHPTGRRRRLVKRGRPFSSSKMTLSSNTLVAELLRYPTPSTAHPAFSPFRPQMPGFAAQSHCHHRCLSFTKRVCNLSQ